MAQRMLRLRLTRGANDGVSLLGSLENFRRCLAESTLWFYQEPVTVSIGGRRVPAGNQPAVCNGRVRLLLTDPDSDTPCWTYDIERVIVGPTKSSRFFGGESVEVEILPSDVAKQQEKVEEEVVAAAPMVKPLRPSPPTRPARRCPTCEDMLEANTIGLLCFRCGSKLPDGLAVPLVFGVALKNGWEQLADHQRERIHACFRRVERGRKFTRQVPLDDRYLVLLVAERDDASTMSDQNVLAEVLDELNAGAVLTDTYEIETIWKMLRERYGKKVYRRKE